MGRGAESISSPAISCIITFPAEPALARLISGSDVKKIVISGSGVYSPPDSISNEELVSSFNLYAARFNQSREEEISAGKIEPLKESTPEFISRVSGIKSRYVVNKSGILDPEIMRPRIREYSDEGVSIQARMGEDAGRKALKEAEIPPGDVDALIVACTAVERLYPAVSIEIQNLLGAKGFAFDLQATCSSMPFGIQTARDAILSGSARRALVISPEICTARVSFRDRETHFIFGDAAASVVLERAEDPTSRSAFEILGTKIYTQYADTVSNRFGFLNGVSTDNMPADNYFRQDGKRLLRDIAPMVSGFILSHLAELGLSASSLKRLWLHQANSHLNKLVCKKVLGREPEYGEAPLILDEFANTSSAGSIIAFDRYKDDFEKGELGLICAFGAGYSAGSVILRKV